ncbi:MAG: ATP-binding protein [Kiritimatiellia bacterium]
MLLKLEVENWACFKGEIALSMMATAERGHKERLAQIGTASRPVRVLPTAAIYGGNAAGKSSLINALAFIQQLVIGDVASDHSLATRPYLLSDETRDAPSRFSIMFLAEKAIYELKIALTANQIVEESLRLYDKRGEVKEILYTRTENKVEFSERLNLEKKAFLDIVVQAIDCRRLFLTTAVQLKVEDFRSAFLWFRNTLIILRPELNFQPVNMLFDDGPCSNKTHQLLEKFGTGIHGISCIDVPESTLPFSDDDWAKIDRYLAESKAIRFSLGREIYLISKQTNNERRIARMVANHPTEEGKTVQFSMSRESDGTLRMLDLIPALHLLESNEKVVVIDEFDRSLHHLICLGLIEDIHNFCTSKTRSQFIFTTHDLLLMNQSTFRRDEMWIVDKRCANGSELYSFSDYEDVRNDRNLLRSYLNGRLGGIPSKCNLVQKSAENE